MIELIQAIANGIVDDKSAVRVTSEPSTEEENTIIYHLSVAKDDMGRIIGKQGRVAKAIRLLARVAAKKYDQKAIIKIEDEE